MNIQDNVARFREILIEINDPSNDSVVRKDEGKIVRTDRGWERSVVESVTINLEFVEVIALLNELANANPADRGEMLVAMIEDIEARRLSLWIRPGQLQHLRHWATESEGGQALAKRFEAAVPIAAGHHVKALREPFDSQPERQLHYILSNVVYRDGPLNKRQAETLVYFIAAAGGRPAPHGGDGDMIPSSVSVPIKEGRWRDNAVKLLHEAHAQLASGDIVFEPEADHAAREALEYVVYEFNVKDLMGRFGEPNWRWRDERWPS